MSSNQHHAGRLQLAEAVLKALFTTSPTKATDVIVKNDGEVVVRSVDKHDGAHSIA
jgi:hypothetical protein